jgi:predicted PurR-regulated permease PerM
MTETQAQPQGSGVRDTFLVMASIVVVLAGARYASNLLIPLLLALFLAFICGSPVNALKKRGISGWVAASLVGGGIAVLFSLLFVLLGSTAESFLDEVPRYQAQFQELGNAWVERLGNWGVDINPDHVREALNPSAALGFFGGFLSGLGGTLSNLVLIIFTTVFILADAHSFPAKLAASQLQGHSKYLQGFQDLVIAMNSYIATKTAVSGLTGLLVGVGLALLDVKFAFLWGFLAFLLNFVPNIGSILAAVPPLLLSLLVMDPALTGSIVGLYVVVNLMVGNVIEPRWMGQAVGLSTLAVFLSLVFWGYMFGAVGMLLSVPLTMCIKFLAMQSPGSRWVGILLSSHAPLAVEGQQAGGVEAEEGAANVQ